MGPLSDKEFLSLLKNQCIALTGGIATGKSTVAEMIRDMGYSVIDADQLARNIVQPGSPALQELVQAFGKEILLQDGQLNRSKIRSLVMSDEASRMRLEGITHPAIQRQFRHEVELLQPSVGEKPFFYEAALIYESGREGLFREVWSTYCPEPIQIERLQTRSSLNHSEALNFLAAQMPAAEKARKAHRTINTDCSLENLRSKVEDFIKGLAP